MSKNYLIICKPIVILTALLLAACSLGGNAETWREKAGEQKDSRHTVKFESNGGSHVPNQKVAEGGLATRPPDPSRPGIWEFGNWYSDDELTCVYDFLTEVHDSFTLYAAWIDTSRSKYNVIFNSNGGTFIEPQQVYEGDCSVRPDDPVRPGYAFDNWYADINFNVQFGFSAKITRHIEIFARWIPAVVTFDKNGGDTDAEPNVMSVTPPAVSLFALPGPPTCSGWTFSGWNTKSDGTGLSFTAATTITGNITVYAQWISAVVIFDKNKGDTEADPVTMPVIPPAVSIAALPVPPSRHGYSFSGWNTLSDGSGIAFTEASIVKGDTKVYAVWSSTVTFDKNNSDAESTDAYPLFMIVTPPAAALAVLPEQPLRTGWEFIGWNTRSDGKGTAFTVAASVSGDITVFAQWIPVIVINAQPAKTTNLTVGDINGSLSVSAVIPGGNVLSYQWYVNTTDNNESGTAISGAQNPVFTIPTYLTVNNSPYFYYCIISALGGAISVSSDTAKVNVVVPVITINTQPADKVNFLIGNISGSLNVDAGVTGKAVLSYQWYSSTANSNSNGTAAESAASAGFTIPTALALGTHYYFCEIGASNGAVSVRSDVSAVTVIPLITINTQPAAVTNVTVGGISGNLSVSADVSVGAALSYQWYSSPTNSNSGGTAINGAENADFTIPVGLTTAGSPYYYYCTVSANYGAVSVSSTVARVNVVVPVITITTQPAPATSVTLNDISGSLNVSAGVTGGAMLSYQWYRNTTNSNTGGTAINGEINSGFTIPTSLTTAGSPYYYYCLVSATNGAASVRSGAATVYVTLGMEMVWVQAGNFERGKNLGSGGGSDQGTVHTVTLTSGFYMGKYQVTQEQYYAVMGTNPSYLSGNPAEGEVQGKRPVEGLHWYNAVGFCNELSTREGLTPYYTINQSGSDSGNLNTNSNDPYRRLVTTNAAANGYRLPTDAQWEYAAKGGNGSPDNCTYSGSDAADDVAWYNGNSENITHQVGLKNPNGLGLYDMSGNVYEWCWDWFPSFSSGAVTDPAGGSSGYERVVRGGAYNTTADDCRSVRQVWPPYPASQRSDIGFRLIRP